MATKPMVTAIPGGLEFGYLEGPEEGVVVQVQEIAMGRDNSISGEPAIGFLRSDIDGNFTRFQLNLTSMRARRRLADTLIKCVVQREGS